MSTYLNGAHERVLADSLFSRILVSDDSKANESKRLRSCAITRSTTKNGSGQSSRDHWELWLERLHKIASCRTQPDLLCQRRRADRHRRAPIRHLRGLQQLQVCRDRCLRNRPLQSRRSRPTLPIRTCPLSCQQGATTRPEVCPTDLFLTTQVISITCRYGTMSTTSRQCLVWSGSSAWSRIRGAGHGRPRIPDPF